MSSRIRKDKKLLDYELYLGKTVEPIDISRACVPFSVFFEEITPEEKCVIIKDFAFAKLEPELRSILIKEFL